MTYRDFEKGKMDGNLRSEAESRGETSIIADLVGGPTYYEGGHAQDVSDYNRGFREGSKKH